MREEGWGGEGEGRGEGRGGEGGGVKATFRMWLKESSFFQEDFP
jgi:hypothetical protein